MERFENKVWLSSPTMHGPELEYVKEAYETNWMSTVGKNINEVERLNFYFIKKFGNMGAAFTTMLGFAVTFYIRIFGMKKIIDIKIEIVKDTIVYFLLIIQAFLISLEVMNAYILGILILGLIIFLYRKSLIQVINIIWKLFLKMKRRN